MYMLSYILAGQQSGTDRDMSSLSEAIEHIRLWKCDVPADGVELYRKECDGKISRLLWSVERSKEGDSRARMWVTPEDPDYPALEPLVQAPPRIVFREWYSLRYLEDGHARELSRFGTLLDACNAASLRAQVPADAECVAVLRESDSSVVYWDRQGRKGTNLTGDDRDYGLVLKYLDS